MLPGIPQSYLPARVSEYTIGWEGEMRTYGADSPRIRKGQAFVFEDTVINLWAKSDEAKVAVRIDGEESSAPRFHNGSRYVQMDARDLRNSTFAIGLLSFGDRHIVEVTGTNAKITAVDAKLALNRVWQGVESSGWKLPAKTSPLDSEWGSPYGNRKVVLQAGQTATLSWVGTDCSVAWFDRAGGGSLTAQVEGGPSFTVATNTPFTLASGEQTYLENRKGLLHLPYGLHKLEIKAGGGPVELLGAFIYDTRANRQAERVQQGLAGPGDTIRFSAPYAAVPVVSCGEGLNVKSVSREEVTFQGTKPATYQVTGE